MSELTYSIVIDADRAHVWDTMLAPGKYEQWVKAFSEHSRFEGRWAEGETMRFVDANLGGTKARLDVCRRPECIVARHVAVIAKDGAEDTDSETAKQWIGTLEKYALTESAGETTLTITMEVHPAFVEMFDSCWPPALQTIKALAEEPRS